MGVITPFITDRGPPCTSYMTNSLFNDWIEFATNCGDRFHEFKVRLSVMEIGDPEGAWSIEIAPYWKQI